MKSGTIGKGLAVVMIIFSLLIIFLICFIKISDKNLRNAINQITDNPDYSDTIKLENFPVYNQQYSWSCGPATISMVYTYLKGVKSEKQILEENNLANRNKGMLPAVFEKYLRDSLKGYKVELKSNIPDSEIISIIYNQLKQGLPVPVYFSTENDWDKPNYDTHYSVVIGIDLKKGTVTIGNAYGFEEEVKVNEFLTSLKYDNYKNKPISFWFATMAGVIKKNNIYILTKN